VGSSTPRSNALLSVHTHLLPAGEDGSLEGAINLAMHEVLGARTEGLKRIMDANDRPSWGVVLWIRDDLPEPAQEILDRARQYYVTSHLRPEKNYSLSSDRIDPDRSRLGQITSGIPDRGRALGSHDSRPCWRRTRQH